MIQLPRRYNFTFDYPFRIQTVRGTVCTHVHFRVLNRKFTIFTDVGVQTDYINVWDFFPFFDSVPCFCGFGSTPVQGMGNINWRVLYIGVRTELNFKSMIFS
jgi:hypothetical protein